MRRGYRWNVDGITPRLENIERYPDIERDPDIERYPDAVPGRGVGGGGDATGLEAIERDLDTVDRALDALGSGDLEEAESLAAELEGPSEGAAAVPLPPADGSQAGPRS